MRARHLFILGTFIAALLCGPRSVGHAQVGGADKDAVVVLKNGNILVGKVTVDSGGYDVATAGAVLRARRADVEYVATSLIDVYERRRAAIQPDSAAAHLDMARWCLRYGLWPQAALEIIDVRGIDPDLAGLALVEQQLAAKTIRRAELDFEANDSDDIESVPKRTSSEEVDKVIGRLPSGAVEQFVRRVQPVLVSNCTAVACHRVDGPSEYQLSRALLYGEANRQTTTRNLIATLGQVNRNEPRQSLLLRMSLRAHGGSEGPPLDAHRRELHGELVRWVEFLREKNVAATSVEGGSVEIARQRYVDRPAVKRGAFGAIHPRAHGRHGTPNVKFGLKLRKVEEPESDTK